MNSNSDEFNKWGKLELISHHEIEAGELASIKLQFIVGSIGLDQGATLTIWTDSDSDWVLRNSTRTSAKPRYFVRASAYSSFSPFPTLSRKSPF